MKQTSSLTRGLADAQEQHAREQHDRAARSPYQAGDRIYPASSLPYGRGRVIPTVTPDDSAPAFNAAKKLYRLYTQFLPGVKIAPLVKRYFDGATLLFG